MNRRYCVTLGVLQLAVDTGGRPHKALRSAAPSSPNCSLRLRFLIVARIATGGSLGMLPKCQGSVRAVLTAIEQAIAAAAGFSRERGEDGRTLRSGILKER